MKKSKKEHMSELVAQWQTSSLSQKAFSQANNLNYQTFNHWVNKLKSPTFIPIKPSSSKTLQTATIKYPNGIELHLENPNSAILKELVHV